MGEPVQLAPELETASNPLLKLGATCVGEPQRETATVIGILRALHQSGANDAVD